MIVGIVALLEEVLEFIRMEKDAHDAEYGPEYGADYQDMIIKILQGLKELRGE